MGNSKIIIKMSDVEKDFQNWSNFKAEVERLREENECFEAMKQGENIRIADLEAEIERLRGLIWDVVDNARYENEEEIAVLTKDFDKMAFAIANQEKEVGDE